MKKKKHTVSVVETVEDKKERQRQWAIKRKFKIREHLYQIGKLDF
jgi:hypothetical protein